MLTKSLTFLAGIALLGVILTGAYSLTQAYPTNIATALQTIIGYAKPLNWLVPVNTAITILGLILLIEFSIFIISSVIWIYDKITQITSN